ncbi:MAG: transcriptional regulator [Desulfovibrionaceae bacterium]|nr:transcriptional regulator [Desulfovibrionaceae bacterium]
MNPNDLETLVTATQTIAAVLSGLGVPGLLALALSGPAMVIVAMLYFEHLRTKRAEQSQQIYREETSRILEAYRIDTQKILREVGGEHAEAVAQYRENVEFVKNYERMADSLQTLIVNNTRAMERLTTIVETRKI